MADYLIKPVEREELLESLRRCVGPGSHDPARILVVDDEPDARELLAEILKSEGYLSVLAKMAKRPWRRWRELP